ncbi:MAG: hypothetical protein PHY99_05610, partial [Bacteroidales bacterium]|nr:hypothetical protein [Bacteroidales bacterium]
QISTFSGYTEPLLSGGIEIRFRVNVTEFSEKGVYPKCIEWFTSNFESGVYKETPERFFNRIMMGLHLSDTILVRTLGDIEVEMTYAAERLRDYIYQSNWDGMIETPATTIPGAIGVFSTKSKGKLSGMQLDSQSLDSLCNGQKGKHLKFVHW